MRSTVSHPYIPPIPGSDGKHVVTDRDVLGGEATVGANVVVVDDVHTQEATASLRVASTRRSSTAPERHGRSDGDVMLPDQPDWNAVRPRRGADASHRQIQIVTPS